MCNGKTTYIENSKFVSPPDATLCPLRDMCYRYTAKPNEHWQSFQLFGPYNGTCPHFYRGYTVTEKDLTERMFLKFTEFVQAIADNDEQSAVIGRHALLTVGTLANELKLSVTLTETYRAAVAKALGAHPACVRKAMNEGDTEDE
jgi:hypothetical protein